MASRIQSAKGAGRNDSLVQQLAEESRTRRLICSARGGGPSTMKSEIDTLGPVVVILVLFALLMLLYGRPVIQNDGISYYGMTLSLLKDGDFNLQNQYEEIPEIRMKPLPEGKLASYYSCG